jgi:hypothetical protein
VEGTSKPDVSSLSERSFPDEDPTGPIGISLGDPSHSERENQPPALSGDIPQVSGDNKTDDTGSVSGTNSSESGPDKKPYLHRWSVVVPIVAMVVAGTIATYVGLRPKESQPAPNLPLASGLPPGVALAPEAAILPPGTRQYVNSTVTGGWGPQREMFTYKSTPGYPVLNSISDMPTWGDTRDFVSCRVNSKPIETGGSTIAITRASTVTVFIKILNSSAKPGADLTNVKMELLLPEGPVDDPGVGVILSADNSPIESVWGGCVLQSRTRLVVALEPNSGLGSLSRGGAGNYEYDVPVADAVIRGEDLLPPVDGAAPGVVPANGAVYGTIRFTLLVQPV